MSEQSKSTRDNLFTYLSIFISLLWLFFIAVDYINKHPAYNYAFEYFRYTKLCIQLIVIAGIILAFQKLFPEKRKLPINGLSTLVLGVIICFLIIGSHKSLVNFQVSSAELLNYLGTTFASAIQLVLLGLICRSAGQWIYRKLFNGKIKSMYLLDLGLGLIALVGAMFILGMLNFLNAWSLIGTLVVLILLNAKGFLNNLKNLFFKARLKKDWSSLGHISVYVIFAFILINLVSVQSAFPAGFDSRNYYMNISNLIAGQGTLISGYPPYNGSLINAIGLILFNQIELSLSISMSGIILVLLVSYRIAVDKLGFDKNRTAFLLALLIVIPAIVNQMYVELKVDFMMLFYQMLAIYYLLEINSKYLENSKVMLNPKQTLYKFLPAAALLGILLGFGMGIKMINLFLVVVVFVLLIWDKDNNWTGLGVICLGVMVYIFGGIDEISGLRKYHLNVNVLGLALGILGLLLLAAGIYFHRSNAYKRILFSSITAIFLLLTMSPWILKNYADTKSLSPKVILMGSSPGPDINLGRIVKNYKDSKKK